MQFRILFSAIVPLLTALCAFAESPLKLGVLAPMTGEFARFGVEIARGTELAVADLKERGIEVRLTAEDACLPEQSVTALKRMLDQEKIDGLAASYCVIGTAAIAPILKQRRLVSFHTSPISEDILRGGEYLMTTNVSIQEEATALAELAFTEMRAHRVALLGLSTPWGQDYLKFFKERYEALGGAVTTVQESPIGQSDFRAELLRVRGSKPDLIFAAHISGMLGNILKQARNLGITQPFIGTDESEDKDVIATAGSAAEGFRFLSLEPNSKSASAFRERWIRHYGGEGPHSIGSNAYDATMLLGETLSICNRDPECALKRLRTSTNVLGAGGDSNLQGETQTSTKFRLKEIRGGQFVDIEGAD